MTAQEAVVFLANRRRVVLLGGMAVILHGLSRSTKDYDIWLDPLPEPEVWALEIKELMAVEPTFQAQRIDPVFFGNWLPVSRTDIARVGVEDGLIRLAGVDRPIDVFYLPNEIEISDFEGVWQRSTPMEHGLRLIEKIDLIVTKQLTDRAIDRTPNRRGRQDVHNGRQAEMLLVDESLLQEIAELYGRSLSYGD